MSKKPMVTDQQLLDIYNKLTIGNNGSTPSSGDVASGVLQTHNIKMDAATIRGRFIAMGRPFGGSAITAPVTPGLIPPLQPTPMPSTLLFTPPATPNPMPEPVEMGLMGGQKVQILDIVKTVKESVPPGMTPEMRAMAGDVFEIDYVDNKGFVHAKESPLMWAKEWLTTEIKAVIPKFLKTLPVKRFQTDDTLMNYVPKKEDFDGWYVKRDVDERLAHHYLLGKHPLTQGKQGTGKTQSHAYFAYEQGLPFFLFSCYEDFKLEKLFGDKTIVNGSVQFIEGVMVRATQVPSVICFDEVNALSQPNTYNFHAFLQNRELFVKDADGGNGKTYRLHPDCMIGFAQNPKSAKYIGGNVRASNFLGRCTYITYPEFTKAQLLKSIALKHPTMPKDHAEKFIAYYQACVKALDENNIPVDISIRQLNNVIDLYIHGMPLKHAIEDGLTSIVEAASHPKAKESLMVLAESTWGELMNR